ncbi:MAG: hypothetical protein M3O01_14075, partial [Pseudomonadota bacterium]|nr:hypothetical protein [Pseudomonadota bacterium]
MTSLSNRSRTSRGARLIGALLLAAAALQSALAQGDPPGRVARLADAEGQVWIYTPAAGDWVAAGRNQPLTSGDRLATDGSARAELQIGSATVRLDGGSELAVQQLDDDHLFLRLESGRAIATLRDPASAAQFELDTDAGRFTALSAGAYRIGRVGERSEITVYSGRARYAGPNSGLPLEAGQRAEFWIDAGGVAQYSTLPPEEDAFAAWSADRDRRSMTVQAERYVSPEMTGAADLDAYGRWEQNADYGPVWVPVVAADWAPYSQGHWAWVPPWGWTWVDDAPWGFAPFHYGRWVHVRDNWCWTPGAREARPIYAPALVGWVAGGRGNVSVTVSGGPVVGWVPLAPREVYVPSYRVSPRYAERINISYVNSASAIRTVLNNPQGPRDFENRRIPRGVTVVPGSVLTERRPVGPAAAQFRQTPWARDLSNESSRV